MMEELKLADTTLQMFDSQATNHVDTSRITDDETSGRIAFSKIEIKTLHEPIS